MPDDVYFANKPAKEIGHEIFDRVESFYKFLHTSGRLSLYRRIYDNYHAAIRSGGRVYYSGEQGEFTHMDVNDFRNILLHIKVMTTSQRPAFEPRASNNDYKSMAQTILAVGLLDYYMRTRQLERHTDRATEFALEYGEAYVGLDWNATIGDAWEYDPEAKKIINEGDIEAFSLTVVDVPVDVTQQSPQGHDWRVYRRFISKHLLAAKFGDSRGKTGAAKKAADDLREKILGVSIDTMTRMTTFEMDLGQESELIPVYTFLHRRNEAVPEGRIVQLVDTDAILVDGPLPFEEVPLYRIAPGEQEGTPFGYSVSFDLLPLQEAINNLYATILTNQSNFGVQNIAVKRGAMVSIDQLIDGLNLVEFDGDVAPTALSLLNTPAELYKSIELIRKDMETISGVGSVSRANPEASLKSGAALALVQSMAIQFNSGLQQSYAQLLEDVGTGVISILRDFAKTNRVSLIAGKSHRSLMKEWTGQDLSDITRVVVDLGNPLSRTTAGKVNMAEQLLNAGLVKTPEQYIQVVTTGRLEPMIEGQQAELMNIKSENERLAEGRPVPVVMTDNHAMHITEHKCVLASPEARENEKVVKTTLDHIQAHLNELRTADPELLQMLGQQPLAPKAPVAPTGGPGPELAPLMNPAGGEPQRPKLPNLPKNALTGDDFNTITGGIL